MKKHLPVPRWLRLARFLEAVVLGDLFPVRRHPRPNHPVHLALEPLESRCLLSSTIVEYALGPPGSHPVGVTAGPDGNVWFTESGNHKVAKITPAGTITEYTTTLQPQTITQGPGPDHNLWFGEGNVPFKIGKITPAGALSEFTADTNPTVPYDITLGPDGNLWFTKLSNYLGRMTPTGVETVIQMTGTHAVTGIVAGPDGNLWFTDTLANAVGWILPSGLTYAEYSLPTGGAQPWGITVGPDGNLWFTESTTNKIGRVTPLGVVTEFTVPTPTSGPRWIITGPDGYLYFTESATSKIGQMTTAGVFLNEFVIPTAGSQPEGLAVGPDNGIWFAESLGNKIGRLGLPWSLGGQVRASDPGQGYLAGFGSAQVGPNDGNLRLSQPLDPHMTCDL